jgi:HlyD family secretion protein
MSASVEIMTERVNNVLAVPIEAVTIRLASDLDTTQVEEKKEKNLSASTGKEEEVEVVFVKQDNKASIRKVKTGIQDDKMIQILEGLKEGEELISGPYTAVSKILKHGEAIEVVSKDQLFESKKKEE